MGRPFFCGFELTSGTHGANEATGPNGRRMGFLSLLCSLGLSPPEAGPSHEPHWPHEPQNTLKTKAKSPLKAKGHSLLGSFSHFLYAGTLFLDFLVGTLQHNLPAAVAPDGDIGVAFFYIYASYVVGFGASLLAEEPDDIATADFVALTLPDI